MLAKKVPMNSVSDCQSGSIYAYALGTGERWHGTDLRVFAKILSHWTTWYAKKKREKVLNFTTRKMMAAQHQR